MPLIYNARFQVARAVRRVRKLTILLRCPEYRSPLRHRVAAAVEHQRVPFVNAATVIDVGANRGQFALVARQRFPTAAIHSFEPLHEAARTLSRIFQSDSKFDVRRLAIGATSGETEFHVARADDSSSILRPTEQQTALFPGTHDVEIRQVPIKRLDAVFHPDALRRPCLLKIDVQGSELEVLRGSVNLMTHVDQVYVECSFIELYDGQSLAHEVIALAAEHGFVLAGVYNPAYGFDGACVQADLLFDRSLTSPGAPGPGGDSKDEHLLV